MRRAAVGCRATPPGHRDQHGSMRSEGAMRQPAREAWGWRSMDQGAAGRATPPARPCVGLPIETVARRQAQGHRRRAGGGVIAKTSGGNDTRGVGIGHANGSLRLACRRRAAALLRQLPNRESAGGGDARRPTGSDLHRTGRREIIRGVPARHGFAVDLGPGAGQSTKPGSDCRRSLHQTRASEGGSRLSDPTLFVLLGLGFR